MKSIFALLAALCISSSAFAQSIASPETEEQSVVEQVPKNLQDRFSMGVDLRGLNNFTGIGINVETPYLWNWIGLRLGVSADRLHERNDTDDAMGFFTFQAAIKLAADLESSTHVYPYTLINFDFFNSEEDTTGSKTGFGVFFGADWKFVSTPALQKQLRLVRAFYAEVGVEDSTWTAPVESGGQRISDGFIVRAGFRRYF
jgi:hypothetical protein